MNVALTDTHGMIAISVPEDVAFAAADKALIVQASIFVFSLLVTIVLAWFIGRAISRPIVSVTQSMNKLAEGNTDISLDGLDSKDEIGRHDPRCADFPRQCD